MTPQWITWSFFQCSGLQKSIAWLRQKRLMHRTTSNGIPAHEPSGSGMFVVVITILPL